MLTCLLSIEQRRQKRTRTFGLIGPLLLSCERSKTISGVRKDQNDMRPVFSRKSSKIRSCRAVVWLKRVADNICESNFQSSLRRHEKSWLATSSSSSLHHFYYEQQITPDGLPTKVSPTQNTIQLALLQRHFRVAQTGRVRRITLQRACQTKPSTLNFSSVHNKWQQRTGC